jgi:hypothetical protein
MTFCEHLGAHEDAWLTAIYLLELGIQLLIAASGVAINAIYRCVFEQLPRTLFCALGPQPNGQ